MDLTGPGTGADAVHLDDHGYLPCGLQVAGKRELAVLLRWWLEQSAALTIGDIGSYGGRPFLRISTSGHEVVLHADTKRAAVQAYPSASSGNPDRGLPSASASGPVLVLKDPGRGQCPVPERPC